MHFFANASIITRLLHVTPPKFNIDPAKMMLGRLLFFWKGLFSGSMLNIRGVVKQQEGVLYPFQTSG